MSEHYIPWTHETCSYCDRPLAGNAELPHLCVHHVAIVTGRWPWRLRLASWLRSLADRLDGGEPEAEPVYYTESVIRDVLESVPPATNVRGDLTES